jgi:hypothetical protein
VRTACKETPYHVRLYAGQAPPGSPTGLPQNPRVSAARLQAVLNALNSSMRVVT